VRVEQSVHPHGHVVHPASARASLSPRAPCGFSARNARVGARYARCC